VKVKKRPPLRRGKVYPQLTVPEHIPRPSYVGANIPQELHPVRQIHNAEGITGMRAACKLAARVLNFAGTLVKVKHYSLWITRILFLSLYTNYLKTLHSTLLNIV
jgi:methionyl aminopeptidase